MAAHPEIFGRFSGSEVYLYVTRFGEWPPVNALQRVRVATMIDDVSRERHSKTRVNEAATVASATANPAGEIPIGISTPTAGSFVGPANKAANAA